MGAFSTTCEILIKYHKGQRAYNREQRLSTSPAPVAQNSAVPRQFRPVVAKLRGPASRGVWVVAGARGVEAGPQRWPGGAGRLSK